MSLTQAATVAAFAGAVLIGCGLEWYARRPDSRIPTFGEFCGSIMRYRVGRLPVGRIALLGLWWWVGWHFFAR